MRITGKRRYVCQAKETEEYPLAGLSQKAHGQVWMVTSHPARSLSRRRKGEA